MRTDIKSADGTPLLEWMESLRFSMEFEFATVDFIVCRGKSSFGLSGPDLVEFVRMAIHTMLDFGARPFVNASAWPPDFHPTDQWGTGREEITEAIIADWLAHGDKELEFFAYPFAFVEQYYPAGWPEPEYVWRKRLRLIDGEIEVVSVFEKSSTPGPSSK